MSGEGVTVSIAKTLIAPPQQPSSTARTALDGAQHSWAVGAVDGSVHGQLAGSITAQATASTVAIVL